MLLIICVDRDNDLGRKTSLEAPVVGRGKVERAAKELGVTDPEDSDLNALFEGMRLYDDEDGEVEIAAVTGSERRSGDRAVARQLDTVLDEVDANSAVVVTDGAEDESVMPVIESRIKVDAVSRTVVKQSENLENIYHVVKRLVRDPETRGTILVPLALILLIYPADLLLDYLNYPDVALGITTAVLGLYLLVKGLNIDRHLENTQKRVRDGLYTGRFSLITYFTATLLTLVGVAAGYSYADSYTVPGIAAKSTAFLRGAVIWFTVAALVSSVGRILEESIKSESIPYLYFNTPFYLASIGLVLYGVTGYFLGIEDIFYLAAVIAVSVGISAASTTVFGGIKNGKIQIKNDQDVIDIDK